MNETQMPEVFSSIVTLIGSVHYQTVGTEKSHVCNFKILIELSIRSEK